MTTINREQQEKEARIKRARENPDTEPIKNQKDLDKFITENLFDWLMDWGFEVDLPYNNYPMYDAIHSWKWLDGYSDKEEILECVSKPFNKDDLYSTYLDPYNAMIHWRFVKYGESKDGSDDTYLDYDDW